MKTSSLLLPTPQDPFGKAATALCQRITRVGYKQALEDEVTTPTRSSRYLKRKLWKEEIP